MSRRTKMAGPDRKEIFRAPGLFFPWNQARLLSGMLSDPERAPTESGTDNKWDIEA